ncbi:MAG: HPF/RaiA family ribosome-associated protein [Geminicoccaceae bacterium]|nr:HPF/RaiA family ribosome-associated protein [Geminicoccaceae bacterium]
MASGYAWTYRLLGVGEGELDPVALARPELDRLAERLRGFPEDAVALDLEFEKNAADGRWRVRAALDLPDDVLRAEGDALDPEPALHRALSKLAHQLETVKARMRAEPEWKQRWRGLLAAETPGRFGPGERLAEARADADLERFFLRARPEAERFARRWFGAAATERHAAIARVLEEVRGELPTVFAATPFTVGTRAVLYRCLWTRLRAVDPEVVPFAGTPPLAPDAGIEVGELAADERAVFELYFREGFSENEIAWILEREPEAVAKTVRAIFERLRAALVTRRDAERAEIGARQARAA